MGADKLVDSTWLEGRLTSIANAIRKKTGQPVSSKLNFSTTAYEDAINSIPEPTKSITLGINGDSNSMDTAIIDWPDGRSTTLTFNSSTPTTKYVEVTKGTRISLGMFGQIQGQITVE